ncbi:MAG: GxxExxY protein [Chthoniobacterales bacterium]
MTENDIAKHTVDAAMKVHTALGPRLLETVYEWFSLTNYESAG